MTQDQHFDVASYALGVLDEHDAARFEDHLIECGTCAIELESFLQVADVLADVDAEALVATEESRRDGLVLKSMIGEVKRERRRANSRRLYSLAAAVVVFAMLSIGALFAGAEWLAPEERSNPTQAQRPNGPAQLDPLPLGDGTGVGGPDLTGERVGSTDPRSGVRLDAALQPKDWGTQVQFAVSNIKGPLTCRLVAVRTDGGSDVLSTWTVGEKGWGTAANPKVLMLPAVTALPRSGIAHLQIQAVTPDGETETLVTTTS
ncbi:zf-HC2 domain-containing protein [Jidongwangia harbinensis]|uniref:zf-HC2 domain-containing protein n=1 Tax=Jidongwangia harbinensis TaxID=2878561 RepID=UPI001CD95B96|nr:zf-HC2 domain-containing protein [Jidongwangia harbinensis]MCA2216160.1 zf-HC2 domain-containing protein [Jidongwangia harbinensis]